MSKEQTKEYLEEKLERLLAVKSESPSEMARVKAAIAKTRRRLAKVPKEEA